jgi:hypothetical protein
MAYRLIVVTEFRDHTNGCDIGSHQYLGNMQSVTINHNLKKRAFFGADCRLQMFSRNEE